MEADRVTVRVGNWYKSEVLVGECREHYKDVAYFAVRDNNNGGCSGDSVSVRETFEVKKEYQDNLFDICNKEETL